MKGNGQKWSKSVSDERFKQFVSDDKYLTINIRENSNGFIRKIVSKNVNLTSNKRAMTKIMEIGLTKSFKRII